MAANPRFKIDYNDSTMFPYGPPRVPAVSNPDTSMPAFPRPGVYNPQLGVLEHGTYGMTLRDYFAAQALIAIQLGPRDPRDGPMTAEQMARVSYGVADAMLAAREA